MKKRMYLFLFTKKERKKEIIFDIIEQKSMSVFSIHKLIIKKKIFKIIGRANLIVHKSSSNIIRLKQNSSIDYFQLHKNNFTLKPIEVLVLDK
jgi:hypothetical protein